MKQFPVIDPVATGKNIVRLRRKRGLSVRDLQKWFGFEEPQAIYKWQQGRSLPSVDNLYALCALLDVPMEQLLVARREEQDNEEPQDESCGSDFFSVNTTGSDKTVFCGRKRGDLPAGPCRTKKDSTAKNGDCH